VWKYSERKKLQRTMGHSAAMEVFVAGGMCVLLKATMVTPAANGDELAMIAFAFCLRDCAMEMSVTYFCILC
jgi:hypothetical protein